MLYSSFRRSETQEKWVLQYKDNHYAIKKNGIAQEKSKIASINHPFQFFYWLERLWIFVCADKRTENIDWRSHKCFQWFILRNFIDHLEFSTLLLKFCRNNIRKKLINCIFWILWTNNKSWTVLHVICQASV